MIGYEYEYSYTTEWLNKETQCSLFNSVTLDLNYGVFVPTSKGGLVSIAKLLGNLGFQELCALIYQAYHLLLLYWPLTIVFVVITECSR